MRGSGPHPFAAFAKGRGNRWWAVLAVVAIVTMVCTFTARRVLTPAVLITLSSQTTLPADGFAFTEL